MTFPPYLPAPKAAPFTGTPRSFALDPEPRRRRTPDPWVDFEAWCGRRGISSLPASGTVVASYLLDRSREIDDSGTLAHSAGRIKSWLDVIDARHIEADLPRVRSAPPVPAVLSSLIRYRDRKAKRQSHPRTHRSLPDLQSSLGVLVASRTLEPASATNCMTSTSNCFTIASG